MVLSLPITSKLWPKNGANWMYLAEIAALTRFATGVMRVLENRPSKQKDPGLSLNEKRQSMGERFFVEILGTVGYLTMLHLGQDIINGIYNRIHKTLPKIELSEKSKTTIEKTFGTITDLDARINQLVKETYGHTPHDTIAKVLYGDGKGAKATLSTLKGKFAEEFKDRLQGPDAAKKLDAAFNIIAKDVNSVKNFEKKTVKSLEEFARYNNKWACGAILCGIALSAAFGGSLVQWANDRVIAPGLKKWLGKNYAKDGSTQPNGKTANALPSQNPAEPKPLQLLSAAPSLAAPILNNAMPTMAPPSGTNAPFGASLAPATNLLGSANAANLQVPSPPYPKTPVLPAYLPNPKIQSPGNSYTSQVLSIPRTLGPLPRLGGG